MAEKAGRSTHLSLTLDVLATGRCPMTSVLDWRIGWLASQMHAVQKQCMKLDERAYAAKTRHNTGLSYD